MQQRGSISIESVRKRITPPPCSQYITILVVVILVLLLFVVFEDRLDGERLVMVLVRTGGERFQRVCSSDAEGCVTHGFSRQIWIRAR